ncbi:hypothetical protein, partial [Borrelia hispanica]|uniref:hypothetical protein n=1 Tax=Borrelia hispanica TaxID=40835 RepID=UPI0005700FAB
MDFNKDIIEENSESLQHFDSETSKKRGRRSVVENEKENFNENATVKEEKKDENEVVGKDEKKVETVEEVTVETKEEDTEEDDLKEEIVVGEEKEKVKTEDNREVKENDSFKMIKEKKQSDINYYVDDVFCWIDRIIKEKQSDIMNEILAIFGDFINLKKIISQKYQQEVKADAISKLLEDSQKILYSIMGNSYEYDEKSLLELEQKFQEIK